MTGEKCGIISLSLEEKEKGLLAAELEMNALNRRVQSLEGDLELFEEKLVIANSKLDKASTAVDDSERLRKYFRINQRKVKKELMGLRKNLIHS